MAASMSDIRGWLKRATPRDTHMIVVYDRWDYEDYPVFIHEGQDIQEEIRFRDGKNMTSVMEVYNLRMDIESQLAEKRAWHP